MLKAWDVFPKMRLRPKHRMVSKYGCLDKITRLLIGILVIREVCRMFSAVIHSSMEVEWDDARDARRIFVNINLTIDQDCSNLHLFVHEDTDSTEYSLADITKTTVPFHHQQMWSSENSTAHCGSCHGFSSNLTCCNSCSDVVSSCEASQSLCFGFDKFYQCRNEDFVQHSHSKCVVLGAVPIKKSKGSIHIVLGSNTDSLSPLKQRNLSRVLSSSSLSHNITSFDLGPAIPGFSPPMDNISVSLSPDSIWSVNYYLHIVPSVWSYGTLRTIHSFKYTAAYSQRPITSHNTRLSPGIHFYYDFFPVLVKTRVDTPPIRSVIANVCVIIGAIISCAATIDVVFASFHTQLRRPVPL